MSGGEIRQYNHMVLPQCGRPDVCGAIGRAVSILGLSIGVMAAAVTLADSALAQAATPEAQMGEALMEMQRGVEAPDAAAAPPAAGQGWYTCDVEMTGAGWGANIYLNLSCPGGIVNQWYVARQDQEKEMLATALTAISGNKQVTAYLSGSAGYSEILACYIRK